MELEFITKKEVENLFNEIGGYKSFIDEKAITVEHHSQITINGINFEETSIKLPTLFMIETLDETQIEVSIQKQQYASGVQPMVYFCIPLKRLKIHRIFKVNHLSLAINLYMLLARLMF